MSDSYNNSINNELAKISDSDKEEKKVTNLSFESYLEHHNQYYYEK